MLTHAFGPPPLLVTLAPRATAAPPTDPVQMSQPPPPPLMPPPMPYRRPVFLGPGLIVLAILLAGLLIALRVIDVQDMAPR